MLFNSIEFAIFLPIVFILYWFFANKNLKLQNLLLLSASYFFYAWWDWRFLSLIVLKYKYCPKESLILVAAIKCFIGSPNL